MAQHRYSFWKPPIEHISIRWLDDKYRGWFTPAGHVLLWALFAFFLFERGGLSRLLVDGFVFCGAALIAGVVVGIPFRPKVDARRHLPGAPTVGDVFSYRVTVTNRGRWTARQLVVEERGLPSDLRPVGPLPIIPRLAPGESATVALALDCKARGAFVLPSLQVASLFPGMTCKLSRPRRDPRTLLVYPKVAVLDRLDIPLGRHYQPGGMALASRVGDSSEFLGTRDWRQGDRLRDLHWPSFARTGRLIAKEFQEEYFVRVAMILDTEVRNAREEVLFEQALGFVAGVAETLARQEAIIDLIAVGAQLHRFQAGRALAQVEQILEVMACLNIDWGFDVTAVEAELLPELLQLSAVFLLLTRWDKKRAALVEAIRSRGIAVRVLLLKPGAAEGLHADERLTMP